VIDIEDGRVRGKFPPRALGLVLEWWSIHRAELAANWQTISDGKIPAKSAALTSSFGTPTAGRVTTVPFHAGRDISPSLLRKIIEDIRLTPEEFIKLL
jgi:hypothetical protein